jgi:hypothetical protein
VKKGLFLDGIALECSNVFPGHIQGSASIEAHLAYSSQTVGNGTAMSASKTTNPLLIELLVKLTLSDVLLKNVS